MVYFNCRYYAEYHLAQCDKSVFSSFAVVVTVLMRELSLKLQNLTLSFTLFQNLFNTDRQEFIQISNTLQNIDLFKEGETNRIEI